VPLGVSVDGLPIVGDGAGAGAGSGAGAGAGAAGAGCGADAALGAALRAGVRFFGFAAFRAVRLGAFLATTFLLVVLLVARFDDFRTRFFAFALLFALALLLGLAAFLFAFLAMWVAPLLRWSNHADSSGHVAKLRDSSRKHRTGRTS